MSTETSIYEYARQGLERDPDKTAIWFYGRSLSYRELFQRIDLAAESFHSNGIGKGSVVTIHLPNCPQAIIAFYAVAKLGAICNMIHPQMPQAAVEELMAFAESDFLLTHLPECENVAKQVLLIDVLKGRASCSQNTYEWEAFELFRADISVCEGFEFPEQKKMANECAVYLHSSGSTGKPKTIMLSHSALNNCVDATALFFEDNDMHEYVSLGVLPLFHGFGLLMDVHRNISYGSELVQMLRWDAKLAVKLIKERKVSLITGVPAIYYSLLSEPDFCDEGISQLKKCYVGGDNVKPELVQAFDDRIDGKHHMFVGYGLTESTTTNFVNTYKHYKTGSCGYPTKGTEAAVMDENGSISSTGEGELLISGKTLMMGYLKDPKATAETLIRANERLWTRTGDHVKIDEEGFIFFKDRIKNVIIRNGYNVYPTQIEEIIRKVDGVRDVCVVGVTSEELQTQDIRAVVILEGNRWAHDVRIALKQACLEGLPRYSVPGEVVFVEDFPRNALGKVDRRLLSRLQ